jgi:hypothetical protein
MERMTIGNNALTKRQIRRLPARDTPSGKRKAKWMFARMLKKQGIDAKEFAA